MLEIRGEVLPYLRPGVSCAEAYEVAQQGYVKRGFGNYHRAGSATASRAGTA